MVEGNDNCRSCSGEPAFDSVAVGGRQHKQAQCERTQGQQRLLRILRINILDAP